MLSNCTFCGSTYEKNRAFQKYCKLVRCVNLRKERDSAKWRKLNPERMKQHVRKARYGIEEKEYQELLEKSDGRCSLCNRKPKDPKNLVIDHDHKTHRVRGLLCRSCNGALGCLEKILDVVIVYVK